MSQVSGAGSHPSSLIPVSFESFLPLIEHHVTELPPSMMETTCEKICRIVYDIISVLIFPIAIIRLLNGMLSRYLAKVVIPVAFAPETMQGAMRKLGDEDYVILATNVMELKTEADRFLKQFSQESGDEPFNALRQGFTAMQQALSPLQTALSVSGISRDQMAEALDGLNRALLEMPEEVVAKMLLRRMELPQIDKVEESFCSKRLAEIFQDIFPTLMSEESRVICRKAVMQLADSDRGYVKEITRLKMTTPDGVELDGIHLRKNEDPEAVTIVFNCPNAAFFEVLYAAMEKGPHTLENGVQCNYVFLNYRGVGASNGTPSPEMLVDGYTAVKTVVDALHVPAERVVAYGWSLGGAFATYAASEVPEVRAVNERSFSSVAREVKYFMYERERKFEGVMASLVMRITGWNWEPIEWWNRVADGFAIHHPQDETIPARAGLAHQLRKPERTVSNSVVTLEGKRSSKTGRLTRPHFVSRNPHTLPYSGDDKAQISQHLTRISSQSRLLKA